MALTLTPLAIVDGSGTGRNMRAAQNPDGSFAFFHEIEQGGAPLGINNGVPMMNAGSLGTDASSNSGGLTGCLVGATIGSTALGGSGPFAAYVLVGSAPASSARSALYVENISGQQVLCVRDDGTAAAGSAPANASWFLLGGGAGVPSQGGSWQSMTFKGRMQLWAATDPGVTARPTIMQD